MMWVLHHLALVGLLAGITAFCVYFPALAIKWRSTLVAVVLCALFAQWMYDKGVASESKQVEAAQAQAAVATKEAAQSDTSAIVTAAARTEADRRLYDSQTASAITHETIHERIRQAPAAIGPDPVIVQSVADARARAEAAAYSVRGTPGTGADPKGAKPKHGLACVGSVCW